MLNIADVSSQNVFSKVYDQTRLKMARMMHEQIIRTFVALKLSNPSIDDRYDNNNKILNLLKIFPTVYLFQINIRTSSNFCTTINKI